jgi:hypothetical protein
MKKRLHTEGIENELRGGSAFFPDYTAGKAATPTEPEPPAPERTRSARPPKTSSISSTDLPPDTASSSQAAPQEENALATPHDTMIPLHHDTTTPRNHGTIVPLTENGIDEVVRKAVKQIGKEAATHRFTIEEKNQLADIEYTYKRRGIKTSENELTRIAINYFIEEYRINGEESLLAKILTKLNS